MATFFTVDSNNVVTNVIESDSALLSDWIAEPSEETAVIGHSWVSSSSSFTEPPPPSLTSQENEEEAIRLLEESDWTQLSDVGLTDANINLWISYRSSLRAIAKSPTDGALTWPTKPETEYA